MNPQYRVLAIIVDYQSARDAAHLSIQLAKSSLMLPQGELHLQIVHVDNANQPPTSLTAEQLKAGIQKLVTPKNLGYAGALNFAIQACKKSQNQNYDAYWLLNSDLEVEPDCLFKLTSLLKNHPKAGAVGPVVRMFSQREKVWGARGVVSPWMGTTAMTDWNKQTALPKWSYIPGCSLLVRSDAYEEVGKLPEKYKLYYEETEFCIQLQKIGWELWVAPSATVYHKVDSMKGRIPARHFSYYFTRNNLIFWKTCFNIPIWIQLPRTFFVVFKEVLLPLRRSKSRFELMDRLKCAWGGMIDGLLFARGLPLRFERNLFQ